MLAICPYAPACCSFWRKRLYVAAARLKIWSDQLSRPNNGRVLLSVILWLLVCRACVRSLADMIAGLGKYGTNSWICFPCLFLFVNLGAYYPHVASVVYIDSLVAYGKTAEYINRICCRCIFLDHCQFYRDGSGRCFNRWSAGSISGKETQEKLIFFVIKKVVRRKVDFPILVCSRNCSGIQVWSRKMP